MSLDSATERRLVTGFDTTGFIFSSYRCVVYLKLLRVESETQVERHHLGKMDFRRRNDGDCNSCPFSEPGKGDTSNPVYQNPPSRSDQDCFTKNTEALLSSLDVTSPDAAGNITEQGCRALADLAEGDAVFQVLYYLDKTYCGLGQAHPTGDDRKSASMPSHHAPAGLL